MNAYIYIYIYDNLFFLKEKNIDEFYLQKKLSNCLVHKIEPN
jgi:hypothetical protein